VPESGRRLPGYPDLHTRDPGFRQRIIGLFPKEEEGTKPELMAEGLVDGVDHICGKGDACLHQRRCKDRQANIKQYEKVEDGQVMPGEPV
jgi:hypothetical protein